MAARMWTSFVTDLNPNGHGGEFVLLMDCRPLLVYRRPLYQSIVLTHRWNAVPHIPKWPSYSSKATNFVFRLSRNESYVEADTYRASGMEFINSIAR